MSNRKVIRLTPRQRVQVTTVKEAMREAIALLGGQARVADVIKFVQRHYRFRHWQDSTIRGYFYVYSQPQTFERIVRGTYRNTRRPATKKAA